MVRFDEGEPGQVFSLLLLYIVLEVLGITVSESANWLDQDPRLDHTLVYLGSR
jgi:hypothetical protein